MNKKIRTAKNPLVIRDKSIRFLVIILRFLFLFGLTYLFLFPLFYMIIATIQDPSTTKDPSVVWIPTKVTLQNIKLAFDMLDYKNSILLTLAISGLSTIATLISCSMVGYGFARYNFAGKKFAFIFVILIFIVPPQTTLISTFLNFRFFDFLGIMKLLAPITGVSSVNLLNTIWTFVLPSLFASGIRSGLFIFIFRQFFAGQPKELEEAAKIDGCNAFATYLRIMVPLAVPAFITVFLFSFVWHWNDIYSSTMLFTGNLKPITVMLNNMNATMLKDQINLNFSATQMRGGLAAGSLLSIAPLLLIYIFTQRYFTESVERAGIVG